MNANVEWLGEGDGTLVAGQPEWSQSYYGGLDPRQGEQVRAATVTVSGASVEWLGEAGEDVGVGRAPGEGDGRVGASDTYRFVVAAYKGDKLLGQWGYDVKNAGASWGAKAEGGPAGAAAYLNWTKAKAMGATRVCASLIEIAASGMSLPFFGSSEGMNLMAKYAKFICYNGYGYSQGLTQQTAPQTITCPAGQVWDNATKKCVNAQGVSAYGGGVAFPMPKPYVPTSSGAAPQKSPFAAKLSTSFLRPQQVAGHVWLGAVTRYDWDFYVYQGETLIASLVNGILTDAEAAASKSAIEKKYAAASVCAVRGVAMSGPPRAPIKSPTPVVPPPGKCQIPSAFNQKRTPEPQNVVPSASTMSTKNSVHNTLFDTSLLRPQHVAGVTWVDDHYRQVCPPGHRYDARRDRCLPLVHKLGENSLQDTTFARAALIAWSKHPSSSTSSPIADYGNIGTPELLSLAWGMRDSIELRAFREWWKLSGYKPAAPANTGSGTEVTYPTASDLAALAAWGKEKGVSLPVPFPGGSGGGSTPGGGGSIPGGGGSIPGGGGSTPPGGGGGGTTPTQCPAGQILDSAGNCQPALPTAQKTEENGLSSKTGVILAAGIAVAAIGLFAATVGAGAGAAVASGVGTRENPITRPKRRGYYVRIDGVTYDVRTREAQRAMLRTRVPTVPISYWDGQNWRDTGRVLHRSI